MQTRSQGWGHGYNPIGSFSQSWPQSPAPEMVTNDVIPLGISRRTIYTEFRLKLASLSVKQGCDLIHSLEIKPLPRLNIIVF